jgi:hypothetical protein
MTKTHRAIGLVVVTTTMTMAACGSPGGSDPLQANPTRTSAARISSIPPEPILETWRTDYTCETVLRALEHAGVGEFTAQGLVGLGIQHGPVGRLANSADPCEGAKKVEFKVVFQPNGYLLTYRDEKLVNDCRCYQLIDSDTFVVLGEGGDPDITLRYRIDDGTLTFDAVMPDPCNSLNCRSQFFYAVAAYAVSPWRRVDP